MNYEGGRGVEFGKTLNFNFENVPIGTRIELEWTYPKPRDILPVPAVGADDAVVYVSPIPEASYELLLVLGCTMFFMKRPKHVRRVAI